MAGVSIAVFVHGTIFRGDQSGGLGLEKWVSRVSVSAVVVEVAVVVSGESVVVSIGLRHSQDGGKSESYEQLQNENDQK